MPRRKRDRPQSKITDPKHTPFIELHEVRTHDDLERWYKGSRKTQQTRIPEGERYKKRAEPLGYLKRARHHTTKARGKAGRHIDTYWFVPVEDSTQYKELAYDNAIPEKHTTIPPPFLPRLKRLNATSRLSASVSTPVIRHIFDTSLSICGLPDVICDASRVLTMFYPTMTPSADKALKELVALKDITRTTGTITLRAQRVILRSLNPEDLTAVAILNAKGYTSTEELTDAELAEVLGEVAQ